MGKSNWNRKTETYLEAWDINNKAYDLNFMSLLSDKYKPFLPIPTGTGRKKKVVMLIEYDDEYEILLKIKGKLQFIKISRSNIKEKFNNRNLIGDLYVNRKSVPTFLYKHEEKNFLLSDKELKKLKNKSK